MDRKYLVWGGVLLLVVLVLGVYFPRPTQVVIKNVEDAVKEAMSRLGAMPGSTVPGDELCINGLCKIVKPGNCLASSTPFAVLNPFQATSTVKAEVEFTGTSTSAISYDMGTSTLISRPLSTAIGIASMNFISSSSVPIGALAHFKSGMMTSSLSLAATAGSALGVRELEVAPNEYVLLYATTTNVVGWGNGLDGLIKDRTTWGCKYNLEFSRYQ